MTGVASPLSPPRKTVEDYLALPESVRAELIGGELYVTPAPSPRHQVAVVNLTGLLRAHVLEAGLGRIYAAPVDVHLPSGEIVQPDVLFVTVAVDAEVPEVLRIAPDVAIEVLSPSNAERDRIVKRDLYAENGCPEYWIVDPEEQTIEVYRLVSGTYQPAGWFRSGEKVESVTWPDLDLAVDEVFA